MKLAFAICENSLDSTISEKFARAPFFVIVDKSTQNFEIIENECLSKTEKLGDCVIEYLEVNYQVEGLIAYEFGIFIQQKAHKKNIELIVLDSKQHLVSELLKLMKIEIEETK